jgi:phage protein U
MPGVASEFTVVGEARRGAFTFDKRIFAELSKNLKDGHYEVHVERLRANRSQQANRYYFGVVIAALEEHTGYTANELHELMKQKFLPKSLALVDGNGELKGEFVMGGSTRNLKVDEFYRYVEQVRQFAAEALGVYTPDPGEA